MLIISRSLTILQLQKLKDFLLNTYPILQYNTTGLIFLDIGITLTQIVFLQGLLMEPSKNLSLCFTPPPCDTCLKFVRCRNKRTVTCKDLYAWLHSFHYKEGYTNVYLDGKHLNMDALRAIHQRLGRHIQGMSALTYNISFWEGK